MYYTETTCTLATEQIAATEAENRDSAQFKKSILQRYLNDSVEAVMVANQDKNKVGDEVTKALNETSSKTSSMTTESVLSSIYTTSSQSKTCLVRDILHYTGCFDW